MALDLNAMIDEVRAALHDLYLGRHVVRVKIEGEETEFFRPTIPALEAYLKRLEAQQAGLPQSGAIGFRF